MGALELELEEGGASSDFHAQGDPNQLFISHLLSHSLRKAACANIVKFTGWKMGVRSAHYYTLAFTLKGPFFALKYMAVKVRAQVAAGTNVGCRS